jgi:hypothetical protein
MCGPFLMCGAYRLRAYTGDYKAFGLRGYGRRIFEDWRAGGVTALTCAAPSPHAAPDRT